MGNESKIEYNGFVINDKETVDYITKDVEEDILALSDEHLELIKKTTKMENLLDIVLKYSYEDMERLFSNEKKIVFHLWMAKNSLETTIEILKENK